jgi:hypothetical protein
VRLTATFILLTCALLAASPAQARHAHARRPHVTAAATAPFSFFGALASAPTRSQRPTRPARTPSVILGSRPPGCPHAFCGCGASIHLFGRIIPALNRAAAWLDFPRAAPAPGMAAARTHHVMVLVAEGHAPGYWLVHDSNSGRGLTRLHEVSLRGYVVVDPRSGGVREIAWR